VSTSPSAAVVSLPLRRRFRGLVARETMLVPGTVGWGEFAAFGEYPDPVAAPWLRAAREASDRGWPAPVRQSVPVNATVPAVGADEVAAVLASFPGCTTAKVKVAEPGHSEADDLARLEAVRDSLGAQGRIRIDVNGAWDVGQARRCIPRYERAAGGLEYVEQPCPRVDDLAVLRRGVDVPIAADESVRLAADPAAAREAADVLVLKVAPLGGVRACVALAEEVERPVVVSSALESSVGLAAGVALAAALPELPYACGLGTAALLADDVTDDPLVPVAGEVAVRRVVPDPARLRRLAAGPARRGWWQDRLARVSRLLETDGVPV
jgi:O-succinylbenzoate synthase